MEAIKHIKEQGEGCNGSPVGDTGEQPPADDLGHYFQFGEIYYGRRFIQVNGVFDYVGDPIDFPEAWQMAVVPPEGYLQDSAELDTVYARPCSASSRRRGRPVRTGRLLRRSSARWARWAPSPPP